MSGSSNITQGLLLAMQHLPLFLHSTKGIAASGLTRLVNANGVTAAIGSISATSVACLTIGIIPVDSGKGKQNPMVTITLNKF